MQTSIYICIQSQASERNTTQPYSIYLKTILLRKILKIEEDYLNILKEEKGYRNYLLCGSDGNKICSPQTHPSFTLW